jgi:ankyrin repeat protein
MRLLEPFSAVDQERQGEYDVLTPLAKAAQQGFYEGIKYLISLEGVNINSVNQCMDHTTNLYARKTPLDLAWDNKHIKCAVLLERNGALRWRELC